MSASNSPQPPGGRPRLPPALPAPAPALVIRSLPRTPTRTFSPVSISSYLHLCVHLHHVPYILPVVYSSHRSPSSHPSALNTYSSFLHASLPLPARGLRRAHGQLPSVLDHPLASRPPAPRATPPRSVVAAYCRIRIVGLLRLHLSAPCLFDLGLL